MKYKTPIFWLILYIVPIFITLYVNVSEPFTKILPGSTNGTQLFYIFILAIVFCLIFGIIFGYLFAPLYLGVHKLVIGRKMIYGIQEIPPQEKFKSTFRGIFPALMAMNFALMLTPFFINLILTDETIISRDPARNEFYVFLTLLLFTGGPSLGFFAGAWFLNDAGIAYTNREKVKNNEKIMEVRSVGGWFLYSLKGYAGIGVVFSFAILINSHLSIGLGSEAWFSFTLTLLVPLIISIACMPALIVLDLLKDHRKNYILKIADKLGIQKPLNFNFTEE